MLRELAIKNFAIINDIRIPFSPGLSVLTGETGAGKSIIIEAVNLLLGGRASADLVRTGEESAELEALFDIEPGSEAEAIMKEQGFEPDEGLMIRRVISSSGKHRLFINDRQATMNFLKSVTENLAGISSQHAHQGLLNEANHLDILDRFAGTWDLRNEVGRLHRSLTSLSRELDRLTGEQQKTGEEIELIRFQIREIEDAGLSPGEDVRLEQDRLRLKNGWDLYETVNRSVDELYTREGSVIESLGIIKDSLARRGELDPFLMTAAQRLEQAVLDLEDLADGLRTHGEGIELNPEALEDTEARLDRIKKLKRKYGGSLDSMFDIYQNLKQKIADMEGSASRIEELQISSKQTSKALRDAALVLSEKRTAAAGVLGSRAEAELRGLEMSSVEFAVDLATVTEEDDEGNGFFCFKGRKIMPTGMDRAAFVMAPNPGEAPRPLSRIASGGELSRVVLALKAVLSDTESLGTLIFDEVDSGIGGKTSEKVGKKLKSLADRYQVICITHLAQIAKYGSTHYRITKQVSDNRTSTVITRLEENGDRVREIARMIGGEVITDATLDHATELLSLS